MLEAVRQAGVLMCVSAVLLRNCVGNHWETSDSASEQLSKTAAGL